VFSASCPTAEFKALKTQLKDSFAASKKVQSIIKITGYQKAHCNSKCPSFSPEVTGIKTNKSRYK